MSRLHLLQRNEMNARPNPQSESMQVFPLWKASITPMPNMMSPLKGRRHPAMVEYVVGEIIASQAVDSILTDGKVDPGKLKPIIFDPSFNACPVVGKIVGNAFNDGLKL